MSGRRGLPIRLAFCPSGCKTAKGLTYNVGSGSCDECVAFNKSSVLDQGAISQTLIGIEDGRSRDASIAFIPLPPVSPNKGNKAAIQLAHDAQTYVAALFHQQAAGVGVWQPIADELTVEEREANKAAELKSMAKKAANDRREMDKKSKEAQRQASMFDLDHDTLQSELHRVSIIGVEVEIRESIGKGRGVFAKVLAKKGKHLARYDGNRVDGATGETKMFCSRMKHLMTKLSPIKRIEIQKLRYSKTWALTNRKGGARVCIDGTVSASVLLDDLYNRGGVGIAALLNSSDKSGIAPNCKLQCIPRVAENFTMANYFFATAEEKFDIVVVALRDIQPDEELTYFYNFDSVRSNVVELDAAESSPLQSALTVVDKAVPAMRSAPPPAPAVPLVSNREPGAGVCQNRCNVAANAVAPSQTILPQAPAAEKEIEVPAAAGAEDAKEDDPGDAPVMNDDYEHAVQPIQPQTKLGACYKQVE